MTPEERLDRLEASIDRVVRVSEKMARRHAGIRSLYRQGVARMEDTMDRMDRHDALVGALIDSHLRTEESLRRLERSVESLADSVRKVVERERPSA